MPTAYFNTIGDYELAKDAKRKQLRKVVVQELGPEQFHVLMQFQGDDFWRALATRRAPEAPRTFKHRERLLTHLAENYPQLKTVKVERLSPDEYEVRLKDYR